MSKKEQVEQLLNVLKRLVPVNSNVLKLLKAIFLNINLLPARETCVRLHLFTKLIMNA